MTAKDSEIDAFIAGLSDEVFAECVKSVLEAWPKLKEPGRRVMLRRDPRMNATIKRRVFESFGPQAEPPLPRVTAPAPDLAADF